MGTALLHNALLIGGSCAPAFNRPVLIDWDRIADVLKTGVEEPKAKRVTDLAGRPGYPKWLRRGLDLD